MTTDVRKKERLFKVFAIVKGGLGPFMHRVGLIYSATELNSRPKNFGPFTAFSDLKFVEPLNISNCEIVCEVEGERSDEKEVYSPGAIRLNLGNLMSGAVLIDSFRVIRKLARAEYSKKV